MRGEVLEIGPDGAGLISGDDGSRYSFHNREVTRFTARSGDRIDFVPLDGVATEILLLSSAPAVAPWDYAGSRKAEPDAGSPWRYFLRCMSKYADGEGRAAPREYWWFFFFRYLLIIAPALPGIIIAGVAPESDVAGTITVLLILIAALVYIATILPNLAGAIRRLHDIGVTGWAVMLNILPFGGLIVFIMLIMPSNPHRNSYGPVPAPARPDRGDGLWD